MSQPGAAQAFEDPIAAHAEMVSGNSWVEKLLRFEVPTFIKKGAGIGLYARFRIFLARFNASCS